MYTRLLFALTTLTVVSAQGVSRTGKCGTNSGGLTCLGSSFGSCCSQYNFCGSTSAYCGTGCQPGFGSCTISSPVLQKSTNGRCGGTTGYTCQGSSYGDCCSKNGWCGRSDAYCGIGCNPLAGICNIAASYTLVRSTSTAATATSSSAIAPSSTIKVSTSDRCGNIQGATDGFNCQGSKYGNCCSQYGYCGSTSAYCSTGCQVNFGSCNPEAVISSSVSSATTRSSSVAVSSSSSSSAVRSSATSSTISSSAASSTASSSIISSSTSSSTSLSTASSSVVASSPALTVIISSAASSTIASSSTVTSTPSLSAVSSSAASSTIASSSAASSSTDSSSIPSSTAASSTLDTSTVASSTVVSSSTDSFSAPDTSITPQVSTTPSPTPSLSSSVSPAPSCFSAPAQYVSNYGFEDRTTAPFTISAASTSWTQSIYTYQPHSGTYDVKVHANAGASPVLELQTTINIPSGTTVTGSGWAFADLAPRPPISFELLLDGVSFGSTFSPMTSYYWGKFGGNNIIVIGDTHVLTIRITLGSATNNGDYAQLDDISLTLVAPPVGVPACA